MPLLPTVDVVIVGLLLMMLAVAVAALFNQFSKREAFGKSEWTWDALAVASYQGLGFAGAIVFLAHLLT